MANLSNLATAHHLKRNVPLEYSNLSSHNYGVSTRIITKSIACGLFLGNLICLLGGCRPAGPTYGVMTPAPLSSNLYDPASYGLPETILGYTVLVVQTPENTACMLPNMKRVVLQSIQPNVGAFLGNGDTNELIRFLEQSDKRGSTKWELSFVGPASTRASILDEIQKWNKASQAGCVRTGGAVQTAQP